MPDKKIATMLRMALDPRTPEEEAIAALRALRRLEVSIDAAAESLVRQLQEEAPRVRGRGTPNAKRPSPVWSDEPFGFENFMDEILRRRYHERYSERTTCDPDSADFIRRAKRAAADAAKRQQKPN